MRLGANCRNSPSHWSRAIVNKFIDNKNNVPCNTTLAMSEKKIISYKQLQNEKYANILNFERKPLDCTAWLRSSWTSFLRSIRLQTNIFKHIWIRLLLFDQLRRHFLYSAQWILIFYCYRLKEIYGVEEWEYSNPTNSLQLLLSLVSCSFFMYLTILISQRATRLNHFSRFQVKFFWFWFSSMSFSLLILLTMC